MRILRGLGIAVGAVLVCIALFAGWAMFRTYRVTHRTWDVTVRTVPIPTDSASLARGAHLVQAVGKCMDCHGEDLAGGIVFSDIAFGRLFMPWRSSGRMTDAEIHAVWLWLRSLPAKQLGET